MQSHCELYVGTVGGRTAAIWVLPNSGIGQDQIENIADPRAGALWGLGVLESYPRARYGCRFIWNEQGVIPLQIKAKLNLLRSQGWQIEFVQNHHRHLAVRFLTRGGLPNSPQITPIFLPHGGFLQGSNLIQGSVTPPTLSEFVLRYSSHFVDRDYVEPLNPDHEMTELESDDTD